jgi:AcrR family transcriptional regulator
VTRASTNDDAPPARGQSKRTGRLRSVTRPKQARSEETLERLLDAAERLISAKGLAHVSIASLAREAGSSVGGFYARFKDKDELLRALHEREQQRFRTAIAQVSDPRLWAEHPLNVMIERALQVFFARMKGRQKLAAAFVESAARRPDQWRHAVQFRREVVEDFGELLALRSDQIAHPEPSLAIQFALHQVLAFADQRALSAYVSGESDMSDEIARDELTRSLCRYLGVEPPA